MEQSKEKNYLKTKKALNQIGKETFVEFYQYLKNQDYQSFKNKALEKNWTDNSKSSKLRGGKYIFKEGLVKEALEITIFSNAKKHVIEEASRLYKQEFDLIPNKIKFIRNEFTFGEEIVYKLFKGYEVIPQYKTLNKYILDCYIPELKLAIEFDERYHANKIFIDKKRQKEIEKELDCNFLRFKE